MVHVSYLLGEDVRDIMCHLIQQRQIFLSRWEKERKWRMGIQGLQDSYLTLV